MLDHVRLQLSKEARGGSRHGVKVLFRIYSPGESEAVNFLLLAHSGHVLVPGAVWGFSPPPFP